jgi:hypothetical protein
MPAAVHVAPGIWDSPRGTVVQHDDLGELYFDRISYMPEQHPPAHPDVHTRRAAYGGTIASLHQPVEDDVRIPWNATAINDSYLLRNARRH